MNLQSEIIPQRQKNKIAGFFFFEVKRWRNRYKSRQTYMRIKQEFLNNIIILQLSLCDHRQFA